MNTSRLLQSLGMSSGSSRLLWVLAAGILMSSLPVRLHAAEEQEMWYGVLDAGARHFRFVVTLTKEDDDWSGVLKSLDEGGADFHLDDVVRTKEKLEFQIKVSSALYSANIDEATQLAQGSWQQRSADLPLTLRQVSEPPREELAAVWSGTINILIQKIDVRIRELASGEIYFDSVSQKAGGFVATRSEQDKKITFDVPGVRGTFVGELSEDGQQLVGKWKQNIISTELILDKAKDLDDLPDATGPNRPQTPKAPFPYEMQSVAIPNTEAGITLSGTLTIPEAADNNQVFPAVVLISGSGPQDRDEAIMEHKPFWVLADHLSRHGIAVLRCDDRGVASSTGDFAAATSEDFAQDIQAQVQFLRDHPRIKSDQIGLCGHSEGGLVAPMVAAVDDSVAFIVLMAGTGVNGENIVTSQTRLILEASGIGAEETDRQCEIQRVFIDMAKIEPELSKEEFAKRALAGIQDLLTEEEKARSVGQQMVELASAQLLSPWFRYFMKHEPAENLERVRCPVLALNGEKDLQVDPELNLPAIRRALEKAPTEDFELVELPGLNHLFQACNTGLVQEYAEIEETINPVALELVTDWILKQTAN